MVRRLREAADYTHKKHLRNVSEAPAHRIIGMDGVNDLIRNFRFSGDWFRDYHRLEDIITDYYENKVQIYNDNIKSRITDIVAQEVINRYPESEEDIRDEFYLW